MQQYTEKLLATDLFKGIGKNELPKVLRCLTGNLRHYAKNQFILLGGPETPDAGIVVTGRLQISQNDNGGNRIMLAEFADGAFFSLNLAGLGHDEAPLSMVTLDACSILFLNCEHILNAPDNCLHHSKLADNLLHIITAENSSLSRKITMLSRRTIREKVLAYLDAEAGKAGSLKFTLNFNRQELADYLCVDRSALSRELGKLKSEGRLDFCNNCFELLQ